METFPRSYLESHPWISFEFDFRRASFDLWLKVGMAQAFAEELAREPMLPAAAVELHQVWLTRGIRATTAIEGNQLTEAQVRAIVDGQSQLAPSFLSQQREVENVLGAYEQTADAHRAGTLEIDRDFLCRMNDRILAGLELDAGVIPGEIRTHEVLVGGGIYKGAPATDCAYLVDRLCEWIAEPWFPDRPFVDGLAKAIVGHLYMAWIHPFGDGNGRTARLLELALLIRIGVPKAAAHLLSNHYNLTRNSYYRRLDEARSPAGRLDFVEYAVEGFVDGLREQMTTILIQHRKLVWAHLVTSTFGRTRSGADIRQRAVAAALPEEFIDRTTVPSLTEDLARAYLDRGPKTLTRDINRLVALGLVQVEPGRVRARRELLDNLSVSGGEGSPPRT